MLKITFPDWKAAIPNLSFVFRVKIISGLKRGTLPPRDGGQLAMFRLFRDEMRKAATTILAITDEHLLTIVKAADSYRNPFDRLLLSVAEAENLDLLTTDSALIALGHHGTRLPIRPA